MAIERTRGRAVGFMAFAVWTASLFAVCASARALAASRPSETQQQPDPVERLVLDNGMTLLLAPVPGADVVAMESLHTVGFLHEPEGMAQAAHLVEHLVCQSATRNYETGEAMRAIASRGMANAEALPHFTHYDYIVPAADLELVLQIEAERMTSLEIDASTVRQEARKCYREVDAVERNPQAGMLKFAFMALNQAWRYGARKVRVREGLEDVPTADLESFHRSSCQPNGVVVVLVGGFERDRAMQLVQKHLGGIQAAQTAPPEPPSWAEVKREMSVQWDSDVRGVCIGFPPPDDGLDRIVLSLYGNLLMQQLMSDSRVQELSASVFCTNQLWGAGTLPFFVYATAKPGVSTRQLQDALASWLERTAAERPGPVAMMQIRGMAVQLVQSPPLSWEGIRQQGQMVASRFGQDPSSATHLVIGNMALQLGVRELLLGGNARDGLEALQQLSPQEVHQVLSRTLEPSKRFLTVLTPEEQGTPG